MKAVAAQFRTPRRPSRTAWIVFAVLAAGAAASWVGAFWQRTELRRVQSELESARVAQAERARALAMPQMPRDPPWANSAREMLERAQSPWPEVLTALESVAKVGVTPVAVSIDVPSRKVVVELEFGDYASLLEYIAQLNGGETPMRWSLIQAQAAPVGAIGAGAATPPSKSTATIGTLLLPTGAR